MPQLPPGQVALLPFLLLFLQRREERKNDINADDEITKVWLYIWSDKKVKVVIGYEFGKTENENVN